MENVVVSIIVPVYNVCNYLGKCIESVCKQEYKFLDIILVDDGSDDGSSEICDYYAQRDDRISVIHKKNEGPTAARKCGLQLAKGRYVTFVDGDDFIDADRLSVLVTEMESDNYDFIHAGFVIEGKRKKYATNSEDIIFTNMTIETKEVLIKQLLCADECISFYPCVWGKIYKKNFIKKCFTEVPDTLFFGEDLVCSVISVAEAKKIKLISNISYHYIIRPNSITQNRSVKYLEQMFSLHSVLCHVLEKHLKGENFKDELEKNTICTVINTIENLPSWHGSICHFSFPEMDKIKNKKIIIHGAGKVGCDYYAQISKYPDCQIVAWVDSKPENYNYDYRKIENPDCILVLEYDYVLVAVADVYTMKEITNRLTGIGVAENRIIWTKPQRLI